MDEDEAKSGPTAESPEAPPLSRRADHIGLLAWRLVRGGPEGLPDFSAARPLLDALEEIGDHRTTQKIRGALVLTARRTVRIRRALDLVEVLTDTGADLRRMCPELFYDFAGVIAHLESEVARAATREPELERGAEVVQVVRVDLGRNYPVGREVQLPDGRTGVVVSAAGADGKLSVIPSSTPQDYQPEGNYAGSPDNDSDSW